MASSKKRERGSSLILFTMITALVLIPMAGLAFDGAVLFWEKARLSAAVDAAALATGRALNTSQALTTQLDNVKAIGQNYFLANFQPGHMGTSLVTDKSQLVQVDTSQAGYITVTVQADVSVPLYFMRIFGPGAGAASGLGKATRRDLNVIFVIDRSGSMNTGTECSDLRNAINDVVSNYFIDKRDTLELITFSTTANVDWGPAKNFMSGSPKMTDTVNQLVCQGATNSSMALSMAYQAIRSLNSPLKLNAVIFFTDGYPTALKLGGNTTSTQVTIAGTSTCTVTGDKLIGVVTMSGQSPNGFNPLSYPTYGIIDPSGIPISSAPAWPPPLIQASGCYFYKDNKASEMYEDVAYLPTADSYGNAIDNGYAPFTVNSSDTFTSSHVRADTQAGILYAAFNTADAAGQSIRKDSTYKPVIYTVGLGASVDSNFLMRLANDPVYTASFDPNVAKGQYVYASDSSKLDAAFRQIVSQILKLSQ